MEAGIRCGLRRVDIIPRYDCLPVAPQVPGIGSGIPVRQNWSNSYNVMIGTEYRFLKLERWPDYREVALRAGFSQAQTQVPDATFNPGNPVGERLHPWSRIRVYLQGGRLISRPDEMRQPRAGAA